MIDNHIILDRIRFEHFYNGVLTFDIHHCFYDCIFCFSKKWRYKFDEKRELQTEKIHEIPLSNIELIDKRIKLKKVNKDKQFIDFDFGPNEKHNNLIFRNKIGECVISTNPEELVKKIESLFIKLDENLNLIRFSGGELTHEDFIDLLNDFLEIFYKNDNLKDVKFLVETSGYRFNINSNERFLNNLKKFKDNHRLHVRISLKNPVSEFYEVLTKRWKDFNLENAINLGIFCFDNGIDFHYCVVANYLSVYDLHVLKEKLLEKLKTTKSKDIEKDFFDIFNNIEFERLFYYETLFKEYLIADKLLEHQNFSEEHFNFLLKDKTWSKNYEIMDFIYRGKNFTNTHEAYYDKFHERTIPRFQKEDGTPFRLDIKQYKLLENRYKEHFLEGCKPKKNLGFLNPRKKKVFIGYQGIQEFWELFFHSRYLLYHNKNEKLSKKIEFNDISILNKLPLYPGIFYIFDFWHQAHPNYFIHILYAEREYFKIVITENNEIKEFYIFSINCSPWSHAHTDISRSIPFFIENTEINKPIIDKIKVKEVIDVGTLIVSISDIRNYVVKYKDFSINVPFYILEYNKAENINEDNSPFLGSIAALYKEPSKNSKEFIYLNYFFWTGIEKDETKENYSIIKAFDYLERFQKLEDKESNLTLFEIYCFEPKMFLLEELVNKDNVTFRDELNKLNLEEDNPDDFIEKLSKKTDTILKIYKRSTD